VGDETVLEGVLYVSLGCDLGRELLQPELGALLEWVGQELFALELLLRRCCTQAEHVCLLLLQSAVAQH
jgi:hypothetical protein